MGGMLKIAKPQHLEDEIRLLLASCQGPERPSRDALASSLYELSRRVSRRPAMPRNSYLPPGLRNTMPNVDPEGTDVEIWTWEGEGRDEKLVYYGIAFAGKAKKPIWHHSFRDEGRRRKMVHDTIRNRKESLKRKEEARRERREFEHGLNVGDILYSSWGYNQTNVNFYEVTAVKGKQVIIREVAKKTVREQHGADYVAAVPGRFIGKPLRRKPTGRRGGEGSVKIDSSQYASKWDGKPKYQTPFGMGH